jgi:GNAT superfamily N-acetyltransferase
MNAVPVPDDEAGPTRPVTGPVIRIAGPGDAAALAALRRAWTVEQSGRGDGDGADDDGFEARFRDWYERESARRVTWLAEVSGEPVGMMNLAVFDRMPRPGRDLGAWGYLGNAYVLAAHRDQGIGSRLLRALLGYADDHGYVRVVLNPSERSVPFYRRYGFGVADGLLVRPRPALPGPVRPVPCDRSRVAGAVSARPGTRRAGPPARR